MVVPNQAMKIPYDCALSPFLPILTELTNFALDQMKNEGVNIARIYVYSNNQASLNTVKKLRLGRLLPQRRCGLKVVFIFLVFSY